MNVNKKNYNFGQENDPNRTAWIQKVLASLPSGYRILDAGAGEQKYKKYCEHLKYVSQDFAKYDGAGDRSGMQTGKWNYSNIDIVSDICAIPEADGSFDAILCSEVLEHIPDPFKAFSEFSRLLRPEGTLIITAPLCSMTHMAPYHFYGGFNKYFYEKNLPLYKLEIRSIETNGNYFQYVGQEVLRTMHIAKQYNAGNFSWLENIAKKIILKALERFSESSNDSSELLNYGFHVIAKKVR